MRTPQLTDAEGNHPALSALTRLARVSSMRAAGMLRHLGEDILREDEDARIIFVRGTYYRRDEIVTMVQNEPEWSFSLEAEPENAADPFAVAVFLDGSRIGYVPRELAIDYQNKVLESRCRVAARGAFERSGDSFTVALLIAWRDAERRAA